MKDEKIQLQARGLLIGYGLQFLLGMSLNLFTTIPKTHPGSSGAEFFGRSSHSLWWALTGGMGGALAAHAFVGLLLVVGSISLFINAMRLHNKSWSLLGGITALFTLGAFFNGLSFVDYNKNVSSMIMATCWLVAVGTIVFGLVKVQHKKPQSEANQ